MCTNESAPALMYVGAFGCHVSIDACEQVVHSVVVV